MSENPELTLELSQNVQEKVDKLAREALEDLDVPRCAQRG